MNEKKPIIFEYFDIHLYLKDLYRFKKLTMKNFSYELWAKEIGLQSRSYLRLLVTGKRALSESVFHLILESLEFDDLEKEYFTLLFQYALSQSHEVRSSLLLQLGRLYKISLNELVIKNRNNYLTDPRSLLVFTYLSFDCENMPLIQIAKDLKLNIEDVQNILDSLIATNAIEILYSLDGQKLYKTKTAFLKIENEERNQFLQKLHFLGLDQAKEAHDLPFDVRHYRSLFFALNKDQMKHAELVINEFAEKMLTLFGTGNLKSKRLYRLGLQLFPITECIEEKVS